MSKDNSEKTKEKEVGNLLEQKMFEEEILADEFLESLQNYTIDNCIKDFREKFPIENIPKDDFEKFIKSRLRFFITSAYMLGKTKK